MFSSEIRPAPAATVQRAAPDTDSSPTLPAPRSAYDALLDLPAHESLVGKARHFAGTLFTRWQLSPDEHDTALLIVGELTANAALHGRSDMTLRLTLAHRTLHIVVTDYGADRSSDRRGTGGDPEEHGRGVRIVQALATRVETHRRPGGGLRVHATVPVGSGRLAATRHGLPAVSRAAEGPRP